MIRRNSVMSSSRSDSTSTRMDRQPDASSTCSDSHESCIGQLMDDSLSNKDDVESARLPDLTTVQIDADIGMSVQVCLQL